MSKTFNKIPSRARVMLDANIVVYALFPQVGKYKSCKKLLQRGARGDVRRTKKERGTEAKCHAP